MISIYMETLAHVTIKSCEDDTITQWYENNLLKCLLDDDQQLAL